MAQTTLRDYLQTTEDAISTGRVDDALANCQYILNHFPEALEAQRLLGEIYLAQGKLEDALQTFDWVLTNDPENVMAYCNRALISERMSDYDTALDCYQQAYELSRGNGQIRQIFNQLSQKVGQQGFVFSRAGLARLYMRGDLLPQAVQEWDTILSASPDRLDARTGLLETYWREGVYEKVEQLAKEILHDVPHCLKALLLLAHVTFAQDALQAQDLMRQVEELDPDQVMAQELFSDFIARQPKDPFLKLLKKSPTVVSETSNGKKPTSTAAELEKLSLEPNETTSASTPSTVSDPLVRWSSLDNIIEPQQDYQTLHGASPYGNWVGNNASDVSSLSTIGRQDSTPGQPKNGAQAGSITPHLNDWNAFGQHSNTQQESGLETWQTQPEPIEVHDPVQNNDQPPADQQPAWYHMEAFPESNADSWSGTSDIDPILSSSSWELEEADSDLPAPPAWLDMLTKGDRRQASGPIQQVPHAAPAVKQEAPATQQSAAPPVNTEEPAGPTGPEESAPAPEIWATWQDHVQVSTPSSESSEEEGFSFGPEWLKSLGATPIESTAPQETEPVAPPVLSVEPEPPVPDEPAATPEAAMDWTIPAANPEAAMDWTIPAANPDSQQWTAEDNPIVAPATEQEITLENWLEQAAQKLTRPEQNMMTTLEELVAEFGNFQIQDTNEVEPQQSSQPVITPADPSSDELLWPVTLEPIAQTSIEPADLNAPEQTPMTSSHLDALSSLISSHAEEQEISRFSPQPVQPEPVPVPKQVASTPPNIQSPAAAAANTQSNTAIDFELETTMKRPVVRLQPVQQRRAAQQYQASSRSRPAEYAPTNKAAEGTLSNKERLIKGYQYQLAGSYDEAMQEYRVIIRIAPELLGEVVSNMRALLKIAPKDSAGYRVLGDAYMRQGEYLQAMEAYNKALTMAKKARN
ncbi:MAG: tetratricopeptide repeat protein [Chloroflexi bacterium]|nr:MAG: tetratricopeptide repeat protein [Chloroflexota bacterium]